MNRKKEAEEAETKIGGFEEQFIKFTDILEEELKETKHYQKILARVNKVLNKQLVNERTPGPAEGDLKASARAFVGLNKIAGLPATGQLK